MSFSDQPIITLSPQSAMTFHQCIIEQGPIRPPSESGSLLLRVSRNCPWNRCEFCHTYRGQKFSLRTVRELSHEIEIIKSIVDSIKRLSCQQNKSGKIDQDLLSYLAYHIRVDDFTLSIALWLYHGAESVFLQDANSILVPANDLQVILKLIKDSFPWVKRITTYARSQTLSRIKKEALSELKKSGLTRIHVGMETGNASLLKRMKKGATPEQHITGGIRAREAGLELSEYIILGLGGTELTREHALDSASVLNEINPDFIRFRTLALPASSPLFEQWKNGSFKRLTDDEIIAEENLLIENLRGIHSRILSDHITNLLETVEGQLPDGKEEILQSIKDYQQLPLSKRQLFQAARRCGFCSHIGHLVDPQVTYKAERIISKFLESGYESLDEFLWNYTARYV